MLRLIYKKLFLILLLYCLAVPASATEYIEKFDSKITVTANGSLNIIETITVHHEGNQIKRGIYRDLSTAKGERYEVLSVLRNDKPEPWFLERTDRALRVNTGDDTFLEAPATSTFTINYILYDALRKIKKENLNELYLNITGKWNFPIKEVTAVVHYPENTEVVRQFAYQYGYDAKQMTPNTPFIFKDLFPNDEVTIAQAFTPGTVDIPTPKTWIWLGLAFLATLIYYVLAWLVWGKDPKPHPIVPDWEVPHDISPLEAAYINNNGNTPRNSFFIHVLWLLHKKAIKIMETDAPSALFGKKKWYTLTTQPEADLKDSEIKEYCKNFPNILTLTGKESEKIAFYTNRLDIKIIQHMEKHYFHTHGFLTFFGALIVPIAWMYIFPEQTESIIRTCLIIFIIISSFLRERAVATIMLLGCSIPIVASLISNIPALITFGAYTVIVLVFRYLLFQPTLPGQRQKERIEGLKMFLKTINGHETSQPSEKMENGLSSAKRLTPRDMEALFPYAVALGLEKAWTQKFLNVFGDETYRLMTTSPEYDTVFRSSLTTACYNSAQLPTSSSSGIGSFGGGHAGGGFGGGGGGGR